MITEAPEAFLYQQLIRHTGVAMEVGFRIYPMMSPQGAALPLIVYQRTGSERPQYLGGNVGNPVITLQVTTYGTSYMATKRIARMVRLAVDGYTGTVSHVTIQRATLASEADGMELPADDQMLPYYNVQQTFEFRINETVT